MTEELVRGFVETLIKEYDYTDWGVGGALAFLYENMDEINKIIQKGS